MSDLKPDQSNPARRILIVTGMSGAGKSTALKALEDLGYEAVDNMPVGLLSRLLAVTDDNPTHDADRPLAVGVDARTRAFNAQRIVEQLKELESAVAMEAVVVFLDCAGDELARRFSETRRRHPIAQDRPVKDGIAREREMLAPLRRWAQVVLDTTDDSVHQLRHRLSQLFALSRSARLTLTLMSFGFARGVPRDADMVFDMRFLRNPHWDEALRPMTGLDPPVGDYIAADPAYHDAYARIMDLLQLLLPRYQQEGKAYLTIAFGCTGGKHRSVYLAEQAALTLRAAGYDLTVNHRDLKVHAQNADEAQVELMKV